MSQYEYAKASDLSQRDFMFKIGRGLIAIVAAALLLHNDQVSVWLDLSENVRSGLFIGLAAVVLVANLAFNHLLGNLLHNDANALRIEASLGMADVGLWHTWYGFQEDLPPPARKSWAAHFCGFQRDTSYTRGLLLVTITLSLCVSFFVAFGLFRLLGPVPGGGELTPIGSALAAGGIGLAAGTANVGLQAYVIRRQIASMSPQFREILRRVGLDAASVAPTKVPVAQSKEKPADRPAQSELE